MSGVMVQFVGPMSCIGLTCASVSRLCMLIGTELLSRTCMRSAFLASSATSALMAAAAADAFTLQKIGTLTISHCINCLYMTIMDHACTLLRE